MSNGQIPYGGRYPAYQQPYPNPQANPTIPPGARGYENARVTDDNMLNIGNTAEVVRPEVGTTRQARASVIAAEGCISQNTELLNLVLDVQGITYDTDIAPTTYATNLIALIDFGTGNGPAHVEVDWRTGAQVSLHGNSVSVAAQLLPGAGGVWSNADPLSVRVSASLAIGSRAARAYNTRTYPAVTIDPAGTASFDVPPYAYAFNLYSESNTAFSPGTLTTLITGTLGQAGYVGGLVIQTLDGPELLTAQLNEGVKLPGNARSVSIQNNAIGAITVTPVFTLAV